MHTIPNYDLGLMAHEISFLLNKDKNYLLPLPEKTHHHFEKMVKTSKVIGFFNATTIEAKTYVENAHIEDFARRAKGAMPYMAYSNLLTRLSPDGQKYLQSADFMQDIMGTYAQYDRGHIDAFVRSFDENQQKLQEAEQN